MVLVKSNDFGAFKSFVTVGTAVEQSQVIGVITMMADADPVRSPIKGLVTKIYNYAVTCNLVEEGDPLFEISEQTMLDPLMSTSLSS